jgi:NADH:ubiquinone oxidoreductase subunit E
MNGENGHKSVLVIGGGIAGIQASLDLADMGFQVYLVEKSPSIGGRMAQLDKTFPTNDCAMCILAPKMIEASRHPNIKLLTYSEVEKVEGELGNFKVKVLRKPRYIDETKCTGCGDCVTNCVVTWKPQVREVSSVRGRMKEEDLQIVDEIISQYKTEPGALMPILQSVNAKYNYLPEDILRYVAEELHIPLSDVYGIATFYNAFSLVPRGRHKIQVCLGTSCYVRGGTRILQAFQRKLDVAAGETSEDLKFSLETVRCIGCCSLAPAIRIDTDTYARLRSDKVGEVLSEYD